MGAIACTSPRAVGAGEARGIDEVGFVFKVLSLGMDRAVRRWR